MRDLNPLSQELFGSRVVNFGYRGDEENQTRSLEVKLFGRELSPAEYAEMSGTPDASEILVGIVAEGDQIEIQCTTQRYDLRHRCTLLGIEGDLTLSIISCNLDTEAPPGIGTRVIARLTEMGRRLGIRQIMLHAAGSPHSAQFNGYYTWPRLGFNGELTDIEGMINRLEEAGFHNVRDTNTLFRLPGGAEWWRLNGSDVFCFFDLHLESRSMENLRVYLSQKGVVAHD